MLQSTQSTQEITSFFVKNNSNHNCFKWVRATIPFSKAEKVDEQYLMNIGCDTNISSFRPLKWYVKDDKKTYIALAQVRTPVFLKPKEEQTIKVLKRRDADLPFVLSKAINEWGQNPNWQEDIKLKAKLQSGQELTCYPLKGAMVELYKDNVEITLRFRSQFGDASGTEVGLSCVLYITIDSFASTYLTTLVIGNDTLEMPEDGGYHVQSLDIQTKNPVYFNIKNDFALGSVTSNTFGHSLESFVLADGQTLAIRGVMFLQSKSDPLAGPNAKTFLAESEADIIGLCEYDRFLFTQALDVHTKLPAPRVSVNPQNRGQLENTHFKKIRASSPNSYLGLINQNPPSTGDQPDFGSTVPFEIQKFLQLQSSKMATNAIEQVYKECMRPSFYFKNKKRIDLLEYPDLFFWSGRPHFAFSWNQQYPEWKSRTGSFNPGPMNGWGGADNQHMSNHSLRTMYELTGDHYLGDVCQYYVSVVGFNYFTDWINNVEAERCGRIMSEALGLSQLFIDSKVSQDLRKRIARKATTWLNVANKRVRSYNIVAISPFNACDPRVNGGKWCPPSGNQNIVCVDWQSGFMLEWLAFAKKQGLASQEVDSLIDLYKTKASEYFLPNGTPKTYFLLPDPDQYITGGIGMSWWSGWGVLFENEPKYQAAVNRIQSHIAQAQTRAPWVREDSWAGF